MKSNVSNYLELATQIYIDACSCCVAEVSDLRDLMTIRSRVKEEGLSFLTITLPNFARDFEKGLEQGFVDSSLFKSFRKRGAIPAFLQGMLSLIFNRETGRMYDENPISYSDNSVYVDSVRQICLAFKKVELDCTPKRVQSALDEFSSTERSFEVFTLPDPEYDYFNRVSSVLWDNHLATFSLDDLLPRHGPGTTAEGITGNGKYRWQTWHERLDIFFPILSSTYNDAALESEEFEKVTLVAQEQEQPVRVTPVPKTLKGPRIIAIEPCCMQYAQQAVRAYLYDVLEQAPISAGHVNFRDQTINQRMAVIASKDKSFVTIDLSEASDRVPRTLAMCMFKANPDLSGAIEACRSTSAQLPSGEIISPLRKFASMGSALCFPVESMYFYTICVAALLRAQSLPVTHANCFYVSRGIYVYGDDIIVPKTYATTVLDHLQKYNCKVNTSKTFIEGNFRESCGVDAFYGKTVTPIYLRTSAPENRRQASELLSWVSTANLFYLRGYWRTSTYMFNTCEKILGPLPYVSRESPALGRISYLGYRSAKRWNPNTQCFEIKAWVPSPVYRTDELEGYAALKKTLLGLELRSMNESQLRVDRLSTWAKGRLIDPQSIDEKHLERTARYGAVAIKRRWVPVE